MTLLIIGLSLSFIAIGVLFYLSYNQNIQTQKRCNKLGASLLALQKEFTQYQIDQGKSDRDNVTSREIRFDRVAKSIKINEDKIYALRKELPSIIGRVVGQIEFAQDKINRKL